MRRGSLLVVCWECMHAEPAFFNWLKDNSAICQGGCYPYVLGLLLAVKKRMMLRQERKTPTALKTNLHK